MARERRLRERVYEVAGDPDNGASVDLELQTPGAGSDSLCSVWQGPDFDATQRAFYYARVVENPSCRWSTIVCNAKGVDCSDPGASRGAGGLLRAAGKTVPGALRTSPIWYAPAASGGARGEPARLRAPAVHFAALGALVSPHRPGAGGRRAGACAVAAPSDQDLLEREARRLGLDRDDAGPRRLVRNLRFLGEGTQGDEEADYEEALAPRPGSQRPRRATLPGPAASSCARRPGARDEPRKRSSLRCWRATRALRAAARVRLTHVFCRATGTAPAWQPRTARWRSSSPRSHRRRVWPG
jgi:hypothetical protein